jgi:hypothetical protein
MDDRRRVITDCFSESERRGFDPEDGEDIWHRSVRRVVHTGRINRFGDGARRQVINLYPAGEPRGCHGADRGC